MAPEHRWKLGDSVQLTKTFDAAEIEKFAALTGDRRVPHVSRFWETWVSQTKPTSAKRGQMWGSLGYLAISPSARSAAVTRPQRVARLRCRLPVARQSCPRDHTN